MKLSGSNWGNAHPSLPGYAWWSSGFVSFVSGVGTDIKTNRSFTLFEVLRLKAGFNYLLISTHGRRFWAHATAMQANIQQFSATCAALEPFLLHIVSVSLAKVHSLTVAAVRGVEMTPKMHTYLLRVKMKWRLSGDNLSSSVTRANDLVVGIMCLLSPSR